MEWSVVEGTGRYTVGVSDSDGLLSVSSMQLDGSSVNPPDISISRADQTGQLKVEISGASHLAHVAKVGDDWWIHMDGRTHVVRMHESGSSEAESVQGGMSAPMPGTILEILVKQGQRVREGQTLLVMEAMKMESEVKAPVAGTVAEIHVSAGDTVQAGAPLITLSS